MSHHPSHQELADLCKRLTPEIAHYISTHSNHTEVSGTVSWGLFLDGDRDQHGIFGTSSALGILGRHEAYKGTYEKSVLLLPGVPIDEERKATLRGDGSPFSDDELNLVLKCTSILSATCGHKEYASDLRGLIISAKRKVTEGASSGWSYISNGASSQDSTRAYHFPTAQVLIALSTDTTCHESELFDGAQWLSKEATSNEIKAGLQQAFALLALEKTRRIPEISKELDSTLGESCGKLRGDLTSWSKDRKNPILVRYYEHIHYVTHETSTHAVVRYMFYPVDVIVALAFLNSSESLSRTQSKYVQYVVSTVVGIFKSEKKYIAAPTGLASTPDAYWCYELLRKYCEVADTGLLSLGPVNSWNDLSKLARIGWGLLLAALIAVILGVVVNNRFVTAIGTLVGFLIGGVFGEPLRLLMRRRKNE